MEKLTISQAIRKTSQLKANIADAKTRAYGSLVYDEKEPAPFNFTEQVEIILSLSEELADLEGRIIKTNSQTRLNDEYEDLSTAVRHLQQLKGYIAWMKTLCPLNAKEVNKETKEWDDSKDEYISKTIKHFSALSKADIATVIDDAQREFNTLNNLVESLNNTTYLVD